MGEVISSPCTGRGRLELSVTSYSLRTSASDVLVACLSGSDTQRSEASAPTPDSSCPRAVRRTPNQSDEYSPGSPPASARLHKPSSSRRCRLQGPAPGALSCPPCAPGAPAQL